MSLIVSSLDLNRITVPKKLLVPMFFNPNMLLTQNEDRAVMEFRCFSSLGSQIS